MPKATSPRPVRTATTITIDSLTVTVLDRTALQVEADAVAAILSAPDFDSRTYGF
jgi:hypothetical protein